MEADTSTLSSDDIAAENARLRARVDQLENQLIEQAARTNAAVAAAQEGAYWLDRWHLDLNALMRRPGVAQALRVMRVMRAALRRMRATKRSLLR